MSITTKLTKVRRYAIYFVIVRLLSQDTLSVLFFYIDLWFSFICFITDFIYNAMLNLLWVYIHMVCRLNQNVIVNRVQSQFVVEIPIKGNVSCSNILFGLRRSAVACGAMYFRDTDCEMLETLPNEECYVRCHCNNTVACDGNLVVNVERDEHKWTLCPMSFG